MSTLNAPPVWLTRLLRVGAAATALVAVALWVTPVNAGGPNLTPFGCGSPATPRSSAIAEFVCSDHVSAVKASVVALSLSAALLLVLSELVLTRLAPKPAVLGAAAVAVLSIPVFALAAASLSVTVAREGSDGTLFRCGTPLAPATDAISKRLCGQVPERHKGLALTTMGLALLVTAGGAYVAKGARPGEPPSEDVATAGPGTDLTVDSDRKERA